MSIGDTASGDTAGGDTAGGDTAGGDTDTGDMDTGDASIGDMDTDEMDLGEVEIVAHRAGNSPDTVVEALAVADTIELDVHLLLGRLEVRHSKAIWPFRIYWERGEGLLPDEHPVELAVVADAIPDGAHLWIDLKGFSWRLARRGLRELGDRRPLTMSCRSWWALVPARRSPGVRTFRSVGNRAQLFLALRMRHPDGLVVHERFITADVVRRMRARCARIAVWGARDRARVEELSALGVDALILDDPELAVADRSTP